MATHFKTERVMNYVLLRVIVSSASLSRTLSAEFHQLLIERVHVLLQLPLLLLHVLQVLRQRLDFSFMLENRGKKRDAGRVRALGSFPLLLPTYLGDAELAGGQLLLVLVHLLVALRLGALQLFAAFHHGLHFRLHLADVQTGHCELLVDHAAAALVLLQSRRRKGGSMTSASASWKHQWNKRRLCPLP